MYFDPSPGWTPLVDPTRSSVERFVESDHVGDGQRWRRGGLAAGILFVLPGALVMLGVSLLYVLGQGIPAVEGALFGIKAAVLVIVVEALLRIGRRALKSRMLAGLAALAFIGKSSKEPVRLGLVTANAHTVVGGDGLIPEGALAAVAGRQVWLQHLPPDKVPQCGPDLAFMLENFPLSRTLNTLFSGTGECAVVDWTFLGLSIAEWSLAWFVGLVLFAVWVAFAKNRDVPHF